MNPNYGLNRLDLTAFNEMHAALQAEIKQYQLRLKSYEDSEKAAYDAWDKYASASGFESGFQKWECQQAAALHVDDSLRDQVRQNTWIPRMLELGHIWRQKMRARRDFQNGERDTHNRSHTSEQVIEYQNAAMVTHCAKHRARIETWRGAEPR